MHVHPFQDPRNGSWRAGDNVSSRFWWSGHFCSIGDPVQGLMIESFYVLARRDKLSDLVISPVTENRIVHNDPMDTVVGVDCPDIGCHILG